MSSSLPRIPEILKLICENLTTEKPTLARFARTSKIFEESALNVLWYELRGFNQIVKCLPSDLWNIESQENGRSLLVLKKPLTTMESCTRLFLQARRVRIFTDPPEANPDMNVDKSIYEALQHVTQGAKIFANIRQLTWDCNNNSFQFIHMFMGPFLTKVCFTFSPKSLTQVSFISVLSEGHPALTDVVLWLSGGTTEVRQKAAELTSKAVYQWKNLRVLRVNSLTYSTLSKLSKLPHLVDLCAEECKFDNVTSASNPSGGFPVLEKLTLFGCHNVSDCISVFKLMDRSPVIWIFLRFRGIETSATWGDVFQAMAEHLRHDSLVQVDFHDGEGRARDIITSSGSQKIKFETLKPLFLFLNLGYILIEFTRGIQITGSDMVANMLSSWQNLRRLQIKIPSFSRCKHRNIITLQDLVSLSSRCKLLTILGIAFDATSPSEIDSNSYSGIDESAKKLEELYVGDSPISKPALVAATLSAAFPSLKRLITIEDEEDLVRPRNEEPHSSNHKSWKRAEDMLRIISAVRSQERLYAQHMYNADSYSDEDDEEMSEGEDKEHVDIEVEEKEG